MSDRLVTDRELEGILRRLQNLERWRDRGLPEVSLYATGTWTPTYVGGTTAGVTTYTANGQSGHYTRIGNVIVARGYVNWTAATGTGQARISLPFTAAAGTFRYTAVAVWNFGVTFAAGTPQGLLFPSTAYVTLWSPATNAASTQVNVEAAGEIAFQATYHID
jgi:hypothetical protein